MHGDERPGRHAPLRRAAHRDAGHLRLPSGVGYLAIIGFPFLSGFFTKDAIIEAAFDQGGARGYLLGGVALLGAGLTAFYMTRLMLMTFFGKRRWTADVHPHESPAS